MRSTYLVELELLLDPRIRVERVNSFELKLNPLVRLVLTYIKLVKNLFEKVVFIYKESAKRIYLDILSTNCIKIFIKE